MASKALRTVLRHCEESKAARRLARGRKKNRVLRKIRIAISEPARLCCVQRRRTPARCNPAGWSQTCKGIRSIPSSPCQWRIRRSAHFVAIRAFWAGISPDCQAAAASEGTSKHLLPITCRTPCRTGSKDPLWPHPFRAKSRPGCHDIRFCGDPLHDEIAEPGRLRGPRSLTLLERHLRGPVGRKPIIGATAAEEDARIFRGPACRDATIGPKPRASVRSVRHRSVAQPGSASGSGPEGRRFKSSHSDQ